MTFLHMHVTYFGHAHTILSLPYGFVFYTQYSKFVNYIRYCMCTPMYIRKPEVNTECSWSLSILLFETGSPPESGTHQFHQTGWPWGLLFSTPALLRYIPPYLFFVYLFLCFNQVLGITLGPSSGVESILLTDPSLQHQH